MVKKLELFLLVLLSASFSACGQIETKIEVVDEQGEAIEGADVKFRYVDFKGEESEVIQTDGNGYATSSGNPELRIHVYVDKEGYYQSLTGPLAKGEDHSLTVTLKKKLSPISLFARKIKIISPEPGRKLGFDFERADWVEPFGEGRSTDVFFKIEYEERARKDYDYKLSVSFPNEHDGIQEFFDSRLSQLHAAHSAPQKNYQATWTQEFQRRPDEGSSGNRDPLRNYWLRVRTEVDGKGEIISANYVKIYGDFPEITYYFNPAKNDFNLEFNPKANLFTDLSRREVVTQP